MAANQGAATLGLIRADVLFSYHPSITLCRLGALPNLILDGTGSLQIAGVPCIDRDASGRCGLWARHLITSFLWEASLLIDRYRRQRSLGLRYVPQGTP